MEIEYTQYETVMHLF